MLESKNKACQWRGAAHLDVLDSMLGGMIKDNQENDGTFPSSSNHQLAPIPSNTAHGKLRAMIELKFCQVLDKQRVLRALVAEHLTDGFLLPINRADFRCGRKPVLRDARSTEQNEHRQCVDRERRTKHKHVEQLSVICNHGREDLAANRAAQDRVIKLGRSVLNYHVYTEKEEQIRMERISKERLKALKADDDEAYMKLIDLAKDTRITHLLRQTDSCLDSLAQAVMAQQSDNGRGIVFDSEDAPHEATFGAQIAPDDIREENGKIDYHPVAHRTTEKISRQPTLLTGGTLKEYQLKGLQWMVSLYNSRLNGILVDEKVHVAILSWLTLSDSYYPSGSRQNHPDDLPCHLLV
jgi:ATP-dependent helicase STH1/SNF2